jgi:hypothetical protein
MPAVAIRARYPGTEDTESEVVSCVDRLRQIGAQEQHFFRYAGALAEPSFFLASLTSHWRPRVVVSRRSGHLSAVVYAKERRIAGIDTGCIYIDATLPKALVGAADELGTMLTQAVRALLACPRVRGYPHSRSGELPERAACACCGRGTREQTAGTPQRSTPSGDL